MKRIRKIFICSFVFVFLSQVLFSCSGSKILQPPNETREGLLNDSEARKESRFKIRGRCTTKYWLVFTGTTSL